MTKVLSKAQVPEKISPRICLNALLPSNLILYLTPVHMKYLRNGLNSLSGVLSELMQPNLHMCKNVRSRSISFSACQHANLNAHLFLLYHNKATVPSWQRLWKLCLCFCSVLLIRFISCSSLLTCAQVQELSSPYHPCWAFFQDFIHALPNCPS
jgi:hypothetical protein